MAKKLVFEQGMQELEDLVRALETGEMSLEESFQAYERASKLKKQLEKLLDDGDMRIRMLTEDGETEMNAEDIK
ncbi:MAG: exodeoxyribonuclease VII small subunit [Clostridia bacterium]|nr:exodeoxyribonuclease VII small subunit [Clostridia bacterium]